MKSYFWTFLTLLLILTSCSGGDIPTQPAVFNTSPQAASESNNSHHALWGYVEISINPETSKVSLIPSRVLLTHANVLIPTLAVLGMEINLIVDECDFLNGLIVMDVSLTHPFPEFDTLTGFDVKGIIMTPGTMEIDSFVIAGPGETELLNRDGLTRWWNPSEFTGGGLYGYTPGIPGTLNSKLLTATLNPFKSFADSLENHSPLSDLLVPALDDDAGRAVFSAGADNTRRYKMQFPVSEFGIPILILNYAIDVNWETPTEFPPLEIPDDFPIEANQPEAFLIDADFPVNSDYGDLSVRVHVSDWQGIDSGDIENEIDGVTIFAPTLLTSDVPLDFVSESTDYAVYEADLTGYLLDVDSPGRHLTLIQVGAKGAGDYTQDGLNIGPYDPVCAYQTEWVDIDFFTDPCTEAPSFPIITQVNTEEGIVSRLNDLLVDGDDVWAFSVQNDESDVHIYCRHSTDKAVTFGDPVEMNDVPLTYVEYFGARLPNVHVTIHNGIIYALWIDERTGERETYFSSSSDKGATWSASTMITDFETDSIPENHFPYGYTVESDDSGRIHALWVDGRMSGIFHVYYSYSDDQCMTWQSPEKVDDSDYHVYSGSMAVLPGGSVNVTFTDRRHYDEPPITKSDIYFDRRDALTPFGVDVMVNTPALDERQSSPTVGVAPDGTIHITWMDYRNGSGWPESRELYYARSEDGGVTFIDEQEIPSVEGYTRLEMMPKIEVSLWGNPYIYYGWESGNVISISCDGGLTWGDQADVFLKPSGCYLRGAGIFTMSEDGTMYTTHAAKPDYQPGDETNNYIVRSE